MHRILTLAMMLLCLVGLPAWADPSLTAEPSTVSLAVTGDTAAGSFTLTAGAADVSNITFATEGLKNANGETVVPPGALAVAAGGRDSLPAGQQLTVTVSLEKLPHPGSYTGQITISHAAQPQIPTVVDLTLKVKGPSYEPQNLALGVDSAEGRASGEFTVTAGDVALHNLALAATGLRNSAGQPVVTPQQLKVYPPAIDLLPAGEQLSVTVSLGGLPEPDRYTGQIDVSYEGQPEGSQEAVELVMDVPGQVAISANELLFRGPARWFPLLRPPEFESQEIRIHTRGNYSYSMSVSAPPLAPKGDHGKLLLKDGATGNLAVHVRDQDATASSPQAAGPFEQVQVQPGRPTVLVIRPDRPGSTGIYSGNLTLTFEPVGGGSALVKTVAVRAVATDGPWYPLLALTAGVALVTFLVYRQEKGQDRTRIQLRSAGLTLRLSALVADAWDQVLSSRLADQVKGQLRDITYEWQGGATWNDVKTRFDTIVTTIDKLVEHLALLSSAEESLARGKDRFPLEGVPTKAQIAGEARLEQARLELGGGDADTAKESVKAAVKIYHEAFGRYSSMAFKHQEIQRAFKRHPDEFRPAWQPIEAALQRSDDCIDRLELAAGGTIDGQDEIERLDYWCRALQKVGDAIDEVHGSTAGSGGTGDPQKSLDEALALLGRATVDNVRVPRDPAAKDNLQKAEEMAEAAVKLCKVAPWLDELWCWFPGNRGDWENHDEAWKQFNLARQESARLITGEDGNADTAAGKAREAVVRLWTGELGRIAWRRLDGYQQVLEDARAAVDREAWEAALRILQDPWQESGADLADQLVEEWEIARGVDLAADTIVKQGQGLDVRERIRRARRATSAPLVQQELARHLRFELRDLAQVDVTAVPEVGDGVKPAEVWGAFKAILDAGATQKKVAAALLRECALVTHHAAYPGWEELQRAHQALAESKWAEAFWLARQAWLCARPGLVGFYLAEAAKGSQGKQDPGAEALAQARKAMADGHENEAVRQARQAWIEAEGKLADYYLEDVAARLEEWKKDEALQQAVKAAEEACAAKDKAQALRLAYQALAEARLVAARLATQGKNTLGHSACQQAAHLFDSGLHLQALQAAETAVRDQDAVLPLPAEWAEALLPGQWAAEDHAALEVYLVPAGVYEVQGPKTEPSEAAKSPGRRGEKETKSPEQIRAEAEARRIDAIQAAIEAAELCTRNQGLYLGVWDCPDKPTEKRDTQNEPNRLGVLQRVGLSLASLRDGEVAALDAENSVDDLFAFYVRLETTDLAGFHFRWYVTDDLGSGTEWPSVVPVPGRAENQLVHKFGRPGNKGVKVEIWHQDIPEPRQKICKSLVVEPSRYQALLRVRRSQALTEGVMVVALASLIGLGVTYYGQDVESFGTAADYLAAFVYGATAKTAQEIVSNLPDWMKKLLGKSS